MAEGVKIERWPESGSGDPAYAARAGNETKAIDEVRSAAFRGVSFESVTKSQH